MLTTRRAAKNADCSSTGPACEHTAYLACLSRTIDIGRLLLAASNNMQQSASSLLIFCIKHSFARTDDRPDSPSAQPTYCGVQCSCAARIPRTILIESNSFHVVFCLNSFGGDSSWTGPNNCEKASFASGTVHKASVFRGEGCSLHIRISMLCA